MLYPGQSQDKRKYAKYSSAVFTKLNCTNLGNVMPKLHVNQILSNQYDTSQHQNMKVYTAVLNL